MKTDRIMWQINEGDEPSMPLVTTKEMFRKAYDGGYAIGAFNVNNMEIVQGITEVKPPSMQDLQVSKSGP